MLSTNTISTIRGVLSGQEHLTTLVLEDGRISQVSRTARRGPTIGASDALIAPLLFDIQVNGAMGIDLQDPDLSISQVVELDAFLARWGVAKWVPTLITGPPEVMERNCRVLAEAMALPALRRSIPGIHLEGPCISPEDGPRGAHPLEYVRPPKLSEFDRLYRAAEGKVLYTTLAPELPGAIPYIRGLVKRGVHVSLGHHHASAGIIAKAVETGARLSTHLGNGAKPLMPRHHNPLWPQLAEDGLTASLIADGHHLPPEVLKSFVRAKGAERIVLTSDAVHLTGLKPGRYGLFKTTVDLKASGKVCLTGTDLLAGSAVMLLPDVFHAAAMTDLSLAQAFDCASRVPAKLLGVRMPAWPPKPGRKANFMVVTPPKGGRFTRRNIEAVFIDGVRHA